MNLGWRADEVAYVLEHTESRGIVVEAQLVPLVRRVEKVPAVARRHRRLGTGGDVRRVAARPHLAAPSPTCTASDAAEPECFVDDRDPISYLYTSGTTSFPKGVVGNHTAIYLESLSVAVEARFNQTTASRR